MPSPDTIRLLLVIAAFVFLLGIIKRPFWGVVSYLIIMMTRPGLYYPVLGSMRIELIVGILMIALTFFSVGSGSKLTFKEEPVFKWCVILVAVMLFSMLQAFNFGAAWDRMNEFLKVFAFFLMIVFLIKTEKEAETLLWIFGLITALLAYEAIYNFTTGAHIVESRGGGRVDYAMADQGLGSGHVALANLTLQGMPFLWYLAMANKHKIFKLAGFFLFFVCLYGVIISGSRGGFVGLVAMYALMMFFSKNRLMFAVAGVIGILVLPLVSASGYMDYIASVLNLFTGSTDVSTSSRTRGLINGFEMMLRRPLLGVGPGCYPFARKAWFGWGLWSHNHYGQLMGDLGVTGLVVWFLFLYHYLKGIVDLRKVQSDNPRLTAISTAIIVATIVRLVVGYGSHSLYIFFWYMLAAIVIVEKRFYREQGAVISPQLMHDRH